MAKMLFRWSIALIVLSLFAFGSPSLQEAEVIYLPEIHDNIITENYSRTRSFWHMLLLRWIRGLISRRVS
ncbi:hypothetical protein [Thermocrinis sp.]|uniref:hypothetical protein n=1 Tax=Thermocrinis sp. TaxID=2024383 RepID=UPI00261CA959|nr:hypothetical protein [Thermocrinis sp.]